MTDTNLFDFVYQFALFFLLPTLVIGLAAIFREQLFFALVALITHLSEKNK